MGRSAADRSYLSIREVLDVLVGEFPDVTISKIRFLESRGLIHPERTPSGYRKFYDADVERLRWILVQQRENFLPLKVIKGRLEGRNEAEAQSLFDDLSADDDETERELVTVGAPAAERLGALERGARQVNGTPAALRTDPPVASGSTPPSEEDAATTESDAATATTAEESETAVETPKARTSPSAAAAQPATAASSTPDREHKPAQSRRNGTMVPGAHFSRDELARAAGIEVELVDELEQFGLLRGREVAGVRCYDEHGLVIAKLAAGFRRFGLESRHLRTYLHAAEREAGLFAQIVNPLLRQRNPAARERAQQELAELSGLGAALREAIVAAELRELTGG